MPKLRSDEPSQKGTVCRFLQQTQDREFFASFLRRKTCAGKECRQHEQDDIDASAYPNPIVKPNTAVKKLIEHDWLHHSTCTLS